ncbi:MAG: HEAT repeat domain-containing protein [Patescibacteria group bacterium]
MAKRAESALDLKSFVCLVRTFQFYPSLLGYETIDFGPVEGYSEEVLTAAMRHKKDYKVRRNACVAVSNICPLSDDAEAALLDCFRESGDVRAAAVLALSRQKTPAAMSALEQAAVDGKLWNEIRLVAIRLLVGDIRYKHVELLRGLLTDQESEIVKAAVVQLYNIGTDAAMEVLMNALSLIADSEIRCSAVRLLCKKSKHILLPFVLRRLVEYDLDGDVRETARSELRYRFKNR